MPSAPLAAPSASSTIPSMSLAAPAMSTGIPPMFPTILAVSSAVPATSAVIAATSSTIATTFPTISAVSPAATITSSAVYAVTFVVPTMFSAVPAMSFPIPDTSSAISAMSSAITATSPAVPLVSSAIATMSPSNVTTMSPATATFYAIAKEINQDAEPGEAQHPLSMQNIRIDNYHALTKQEKEKLIEQLQNERQSRKFKVGHPAQSTFPSSTLKILSVLHISTPNSVQSEIEDKFLKTPALLIAWRKSSPVRLTQLRLRTPTTTSSGVSSGRIVLTVYPNSVPLEDRVDLLSTEIVRLNASALSDPSSLQTQLYSDLVPVPFRALIDSGSSHCFADSQSAELHRVPTNSVPPLRLSLFDGSSNHTITKSTTLPIHFPSGEVINIDFYVTPLDKSVSAVLGYSWLTTYNPLIDWKKRSIQFRTVPSARPVSDPTPATLTAPAALSLEPLILTSPNSIPQVWLVNASAFARACKLPGSESFTLNLAAPDFVRARSSSISNSPPDLSGIPEEYHEFADVFSKSKADELPEHRPYDLKIELEPGATPPLGPIYSLSKVELDSFHELAPGA
ncbi:hypothetical protein ACG7TL_005408 [Trametes sanguinea]